MKAVLAAALLSLILASCTDEEATVETLEAAGFTDIQTKGYSWTGCSEEDGYATKFVAKNPLGNTVKGVVCCGGFASWKGCTIRW
jgi:hypothetical protein